MKIKNTTKWRTDDLRKLFSRCIKEVQKIERQGRNVGIEVNVKNSSYKGMNGRAYVGFYRMSLMIGGQVDLRDIERKKELARLFIHEYYHNLGFRKQDRCNYKYDWSKRFDVAFVNKYQIREAELEVKPQRDLQMERYQKTLQYVKAYETKMKRTKNILKKWKQKQGYYEKVLAASGKIEK